MLRELQGRMISQAGCAESAGCFGGFASLSPFCAAPWELQVFRVPKFGPPLLMLLVLTAPCLPLLAEEKLICQHPAPGSSRLCSGGGVWAAIETLAGPWRLGGYTCAMFCCLPNK